MLCLLFRQESREGNDIKVNMFCAKSSTAITIAIRLTVSSHSEILQSEVI
jgi:hypothetical protein